jgi:hypothetical protein
MSKYVLRIIFEFFDHIDFIGATNVFLSKEKQNVLKIDIQKRSYSTDLVEYYNSSGKYDQKGELVSIYTKQMAIINSSYSPKPAYAHLNAKGNLDFVMLGDKKHISNVDSFWILFFLQNK